MTRLAELLAEYSSSAADGWGAWHEGVARHMLTSVEGGGRSVWDRDRLDGEDTGLLWIALGWAEASASRVVQTADSGLLRSAIAMLVLIDDAAVLDSRDVRVVAGLLRRASDLVGLCIADETHAVAITPQLALLEQSVLEWLISASPESNLFHVEVGEGEEFEFVRKPHSMDIDRLRARFGEGFSNEGAVPPDR